MSERSADQDLRKVLSRFETTEQLEAAFEYSEKFNKRVSELAERWGIDQPVSGEGWRQMALHLIAEHEPGLNPLQKTPGAKPKHGALIEDIIIVHNLGAGRKSNMSINAASIHLSKTERFRGRKPEGIRKRYYEIINPGTKAGQRLRAFVSSLVETRPTN